MKIFGLEIKRSKDKGEERCFSPLSSSLQFGAFSDSYSALHLSAVYRAVEIISDSIAILPIKVKCKSGENCNSAIEDHPVSIVFSDRNNNIISKYNLVKLLIQSVLLRGNGFAYIERNVKGDVISLQYLETCDVSIDYNKDRKKLYYIVGGKRVEPINMVHLLKHSYDGVNGLSVLGFAARSIKLAGNAENSALGFYENGCNLSGILKVNSPLSDQQKTDIRNNWAMTYSRGGSGLAVLQGNMEYEPIQINSADAQLLESRKFTVADIARFFGISPVLLGDLSYTGGYSTIEAIQNQFLLHTLQPYITMIECELNRKLLKPSESDLEIDVDETTLLKSDKTALANYYNTLLTNGTLCINEVRKELGYGEIEGGDKHIIAYTKIEDNTINNDEGI